MKSENKERFCIRRKREDKGNVIKMTEERKWGKVMKMRKERAIRVSLNR